MWKVLATIPSLSHIFFIPYNSYKLQLLMKNIVSLLWFKEHFY